MVLCITFIFLLEKNAFIKKVSESGREYKVKLPKEVTEVILEELKSNRDKILEKEGGIR